MESEQLKFIQQDFTDDNEDNEVISIEYVGETEDYVYDLETQDGTFQAGYGNMIIKNTDSIYTIFNGINMDEEGAMEKVFNLSIEAAKMISDTFPPPMELEFEKVMFPFILCSKKRYAALIWTNTEKPDYVDIKGLQPVRRDNCPFVRETATKCFDKILYNRSIEQAVQVAKDAVNDLLEEKVETSKLTKSKSLRDSYSISKVARTPLDFKLYRKDGWSETLECGFKLNGENVVERFTAKGNKLLKDDNGQYIHASIPTMPHLHLTKKMYERDPMVAPKAGDRVPIIYIIGTGLQCHKVEDPAYFDKAIREGNKQLKIDVLHYLYNELQNPLESIFTHLIDDTSIIFKNPKITKLEKQRKNIEITKTNKEKNQREITSFFKSTGNH